MDSNFYGDNLKSDQLKPMQKKRERELVCAGVCKCVLSDCYGYV